MKYWLPRLHAVVIGPGLGRDEHVMQNVKVGNVFEKFANERLQITERAHLRFMGILL